MTAQSRTKRMLLLATSNTLNELEITHKFLTTGHTQMPVDSMHSRIENQKKRALKSGPVYIPAQWVSIIKVAKKNGIPYSTTEMDTKSFIDLITSLCNEIGTNYSINENGEKILMGNIVAIHFQKETPFILYYKTNFSENEYNTINIKSNPKRKQSYPDKEDISLKPAYKTAPKIAYLKKEDLLSLCKSNLIPEQYHYFYEQLLTENGPTLKPLQKTQRDKMSAKKTKNKTISQTTVQNKNIKKKTAKKKLIK